jgi:hypothetical protein
MQKSASLDSSTAIEFINLFMLDIFAVSLCAKFYPCLAGTATLALCLNKYFLFIGAPRIFLGGGTNPEAICKLCLILKTVL